MHVLWWKHHFIQTICISSMNLDCTYTFMVMMHLWLKNCHCMQTVNKFSTNSIEMHCTGAGLWCDTSIGMSFMPHPVLFFWIKYVLTNNICILVLQWYTCIFWSSLPWLTFSDPILCWSTFSDPVLWWPTFLIQFYDETHSLIQFCGDPHFLIQFYGYPHYRIQFYGATHLLIRFYGDPLFLIQFYGNPHFLIQYMVTHYVWSNFAMIHIFWSSLLRGAEELAIRKAVSEEHGGGLKEFVVDEADMFVNINNEEEFFTTEQRQAIVRSLLFNLRAIDGDVLNKIKFLEGQAISKWIFVCLFVSLFIWFKNILFQTSRIRQG